MPSIDNEDEAPNNKETISDDVSDEDEDNGDITVGSEMDLNRESGAERHEEPLVTPPHPPEKRNFL